VSSVWGLCGCSVGFCGCCVCEILAAVAGSTVYSSVVFLFQRNFHVDQKGGVIFSLSIYYIFMTPYNYTTSVLGRMGNKISNPVPSFESVCAHYSTDEIEISRVKFKSMW
jgi:hypothetical protein